MSSEKIPSTVLTQARGIFCVCATRWTIANPRAFLPDSLSANHFGYPEGPYPLERTPWGLSCTFVLCLF
jgi:hypothetical protein